jgi:hypothetical protein
MSDSSNYSTYWMDSFYPHYTGVPEFTKLSLVNYLVYGYHPGSGLTSILKSDVEGCSLFLDKENKKHFFTIVAWLRSYAPEDSWGSSKNVENWIQSKREERGKEAM